MRPSDVTAHPFGELRGAYDRRDRRASAAVLLDWRDDPRWRDLVCYARDLDPDVLAPERLVSWSSWEWVARVRGGGMKRRGPGGPFWPVKCVCWELRVLGRRLATGNEVDLDRMNREWWLGLLRDEVERCEAVVEPTIMSEYRRALEDLESPDRARAMTAWLGGHGYIRRRVVPVWVDVFDGISARRGADPRQTSAYGLAAILADVARGTKPVDDVARELARVRAVRDGDGSAQEAASACQEQLLLRSWGECVIEQAVKTWSR
jgi:hypothetical protein